MDGIWVSDDRELQLGPDAEDECKRGKVMHDTAVGHCNELVGRVRGENAWKKVKVVIFMFKDMVLELCSNNGCRVFF